MTDSDRPPDFQDYWQRVAAELAELPIAAEEEPLALRSSEFSNCYTVRFTGLGPYRLFAYLSIPNGDGPFPTLLYGPGYRSVVEPLPQGDASAKRSRFLIFTVASRGQRNADQPFAAQFPGLLTEGIDDPATYVFRGIVADWMRAVDYLLSRSEVDRSRIAAIPSKRDAMSLVAAALRPEVTHVVAGLGSFFDARRRPTEEVEDYLRLHPETRPQVARTLAYFDPLFFANAVSARTLLWADPVVAEPLVTAMPNQPEVRQSEQSTYKDGVFQEQWVAREFGFDDPILPAHWQA